MPGPWTAIEEWRNIDLVAFSAWSSASCYARIGYEVKVSRSDLRSELLSPGKRELNVKWCNEFYLAVPEGLLKPEEIEFVEPDWEPNDWLGERCPGFAGRPCVRFYRRKRYVVNVPRPTTTSWAGHENIPCPTCNGKGHLTAPRVIQEAPVCWVPKDIGLVVVNARQAKVVKRSPRRNEVPALTPMELGQLVRYVSMRPDPRHEQSRRRRWPGEPPTAPVQLPGATLP